MNEYLVFHFPYSFLKRRRKIVGKGTGTKIQSTKYHM